jgi:hypothetical protein
MLLPHQVLPFLEHDDALVREHAARHFCRAHDPAPGTADDFWRSIDRFGLEPSLRLVWHLSDMPQTEQSLRRTLDTLRAGAPDETDYYLQQVVAKVDFPLLLAHRDELLQLEHVAPRVRAHLSRRLELAELSPDEVWERLLRHSQKMQEDTDDPIEGDVSDELVEAMARHGEDAARRALERLQSGPRGDWMEVFCVEVLGQLRHAPATEVLIERLLLDEDVLAEAVVEALTRIGTVDVVRQLEAFYPGKEWHVRLFADDPLARIKRPESEAALLRLIEIEKEPDLTGNLAAGLCELCTTEGLEVVRRVVLEERYHPQMEDLEELLLATGAIVGYEPPEAAEWRERVANGQAERERATSMDGFMDRLKKMLGEDRDRWRRGESPPREVEDEFEDEPGDSFDRPEWKSDLSNDPHPGTIRRESPKVGRNDPCPCGSGKKYKKCCLKREQFAV